MPASPSPKPDSSASSLSFRLKGGLFPLTLLELIDTDPLKLRKDLAQKMAEAPAFFQQAPIVLSLEQIQPPLQAAELSFVRDLCREFGLIVIALRGSNDHLQDAASAMNLALLPASKVKKSESQSEGEPDIEGLLSPQTNQSEQPCPEDVQAQKDEETVVRMPAAPETKIVTTPVRSGQQIYAAGGDLVVLAPVSAGAEILADGNIHVYGPARGRILAGVRGNRSSRIFCQALEAELVSIAGYFKVNEDLRQHHWKQSVQVSLTDETLNIDCLG